VKRVLHERAFLTILPDMEDQHQEQPQSQVNDDPSTLLPKVSLGASKKVKVIIAAILLVFVFSGIHFATRDSAKTDPTVSQPQGDGVITVVPSDASAPSIVPEIVKDKDGKEYLTGELIVAFRASVPVEEAKKMVAAQGGVVKQHFTQFPVFLVGISEPGSEGVNRAILKFQTLQAVERAEPNFLTQAPTP
jgi:hypothetical protein